MNILKNEKNYQQSTTASNFNKNKITKLGRLVRVFLCRCRSRTL